MNSRIVYPVVLLLISLTGLATVAPGGSIEGGDASENKSVAPAEISDPAFTLINARTSQNQSQFFVYQDMDSGFNHGFPSGLFGNSQTKLHADPGCVYSAVAANGCSTDPTSLDQIRGTVFRVTFDPLATGEFVGLNFEEPEHWGFTRVGRGYDLRGATELVLDVISPTGGINVQFSINGQTASYMTIPRQWTTITINLGSLGLSQSDLSAVNLLFGIASNEFNDRNGGTVLLDNIRFQPVPTTQSTSLGLPIGNQVFGILHVQNALMGSIPIPPDEINSNLATVYESSMSVLALLSRRQPQDLVNARLIADTLVYALGHDNQGDPLPIALDGSTGLHNGYYNGDISLFNSQGQGMGQQGQVRLAGFTAPLLCPQTGFCLVLDGATGGNNSFAMQALLAAYNQFQNSNYLNAAITIGNWIYGELLDSSGTGYGGYFVGFPDQGLPKVLQTGKSTENNADIFMAFTALANVERALGNIGAANTWTTRANIAGDFVMQMFDTSTGHFFAGTVPSTQQAGPGASPNGNKKGSDVINTFDFLDTQTFTTLTMASAPRYRNQIDWRLPVHWMVDHFGRSVTASNLTFQGFDLIDASERMMTDGPPGVAWEFTSQAVATMQTVDAIYNSSEFSGAINTYLNQIRQAQMSAPYGDGRGLVAATLQDGQTLPPYRQCLVTPYQCIAERVGLAATTWAIFADENINPLAPQTPSAVSVTPSSGTGGSQTFTFLYSDPNGGSDIASAQVLFNTVVNPYNTCYVLVDPVHGLAYLANDAFTGYLGPITLGTSATLQNSQCIINGSGSSASISGNTATVNLAVRFQPAFDGPKNIYGLAQNIAGLNSGWQALGTWTVTTILQAVSVTPFSGSGQSQTFAFVYSDPNGGSDIASAQVLFNTVVSPYHTCYVLVDPVHHLAYLANDAFTGYLGPMTLGTSATLQNSQCIINGSGSSTSISGNTATVNLAVTFQPAFTGPKNIYGLAQNIAGHNSGWQTLGTWTVMPQLQADSVTPSSGSGESQTFAFVYSDPNGGSDIASAQVLFNTVVSPYNTCYVLVDPVHHLAYLANDAFTGYLGPMTLGTSATLQNSQCIINGSGSSSSISGNTATVNLAVTFQAAFAGTKNIYGLAQNIAGLNSGWQILGTWTTGQLQAVSVMPSSGSGESQTFAFVYSDPSGGSDIASAQVLFNTVVSPYNTCYVLVDPVHGLAYLANDGFTGYLGPMTFGSSATLQNSQCIINGSGSSSSTSGTAATVNLAVTFQPAFTGLKNIYGLAQSASGANSGWRTLGTWTPH